jgi:hypothetical protein
MSGFTRFSLKCKNCGHINRPNVNSRRSIRMVLKGEFTTCRKCSTDFKKINVPYRPIVKDEYNKLVEEGTNFPRNVVLFRYKNCGVPRAIGI